MTSFPKPKKSKVKKKKAPSRTRLKHKADAFFRDIIRAGGRCINHRLPAINVAPDSTFECPRKGHTIQTAHIFSRRYISVRWDLRNAVPLCAGCHMFFTHHPIEWETWCRRQIGDSRYEHLRRLALRKHSFSYEDVIQLLSNGKGTEYL